MFNEYPLTFNINFSPKNKLNASYVYLGVVFTDDYDDVS